MRAREGNKMANDKFNPIKQEYHSDYALEIVQIDHTQLDIILVDEICRMPIGRPWLTAAIDVYSRVIVGFYLSFDPPGALGTGMCIANAILPKEGWLQSLDVKGDWCCWGRMNTIHVDNAKEFRGKTLSKACEEYGINLQWRPVKKPQWGGHIERLMGTIAKKMHTLRGTTRSSPKDRGEYDSMKKAVFTLKDFEGWLVEFIVNTYHVTIHQGIGTTPMSKFEEGLNKTGLPPRILNENKVRLDFLPYVERSIQEYGVVIDYIYYYGDVLRKWINALIPNTLKSKQKRMFIFKRDPRDITVLFFYDPDLQEYFQIPCRNTSRTPMTIWEHNEILNRMKSNGISKIDEDAIFEARERLNEIEEQAITKTLIARKTKKDAKIVHSLQKSIKLNPTGTNPTISEIKGAGTLKPRMDFSNIKPFEEAEYESFD
jgi:putative transposase